MSKGLGEEKEENEAIKDSWSTKYLAKIYKIYVAIQEVYQGDAFKIYNRCLYGAHKIHFFFPVQQEKASTKHQALWRQIKRVLALQGYHPTADSETMQWRVTSQTGT